MQASSAIYPSPLSPGDAPTGRRCQSADDVLVVIGRIRLMAGAEVKHATVPAVQQQPLRNTFAAFKPRPKMSLSGSGMSKRSPYISSNGNSKYSPNPSVIGCPGVRFQMRSFSSASRHFNEQFGAHQRLENLRVWPRMQHHQPHPRQHLLLHALHNLVLHITVRDVAHHTRTSVSFNTLSVSPCSGSSSVAVRQTNPSTPTTLGNRDVHAVG